MGVHPHLRRRPNNVFIRLQGKIKSLEQIYLFSMPVKEYQIVEYFLGSALKDEVMKIMPVQKQTRAGQRTRFKVCWKYCQRCFMSNLLANSDLKQTV